MPESSKSSFHKDKKANFKNLLISTLPAPNNCSNQPSQPHLPLTTRNYSLRVKLLLLFSPKTTFLDLKIKISTKFPTLSVRNHTIHPKYKINLSRGKSSLQGLYQDVKLLPKKSTAKPSIKKKKFSKFKPRSQKFFNSYRFWILIFLSFKNKIAKIIPKKVKLRAWKHFGPNRILSLVFSLWSSLNALFTIILTFCQFTEK